MYVGKFVRIRGYRGFKKKKESEWDTMGVVIDTTETTYVVVHFEDFSMHEYSCDEYIFPFNGRASLSKKSSDIWCNRITQYTYLYFLTWVDSVIIKKRTNNITKKYWQKEEMEEWIKERNLLPEHVIIVMRRIYNEISDDTVIIQSSTLGPNSISPYINQDSSVSNVVERYELGDEFFVRHEIGEETHMHMKNAVFMLSGFYTIESIDEKNKVYLLQSSFPGIFAPRNPLPHGDSRYEIAFDDLHSSSPLIDKKTIIFVTPKNTREIARYVVENSGNKLDDIENQIATLQKKKNVLHGLIAYCIPYV
jgi:hypothetical protein